MRGQERGRGPGRSEGRRRRGSGAGGGLAGLLPDRHHAAGLRPGPLHLRPLVRPAADGRALPAGEPELLRVRRVQEDEQALALRLHDPGAQPRPGGRRQGPRQRQLHLRQVGRRQGPGQAGGRPLLPAACSGPRNGAILGSGVQRRGGLRAHLRRPADPRGQGRLPDGLLRERRRPLDLHAPADARRRARREGALDRAGEGLRPQRPQRRGPDEVR
mmetsp:Transcript_110435/g.312277  ORF Transcript_110435/g.312277 Transcript_110435/m.312277 type:complete len:216 (-) Transcript_110435:428-1075(-)